MPPAVSALERRPPWSDAVGMYAEMIGTALPGLRGQLDWLVGQIVGGLSGLPVGLELAGGWSDTVLPLPGGGADWTDMITGRPVEGSAPALSALLDRYPVALLVRPA